ncbi:MAG: FecR domain-containing protein [Phormidesmis sp.]
MTLALGLSGSLLLSQAAMAEPFYKQLAKEESAEETSPKQASEEEDEEEDDEEKKEKEEREEPEALSWARVDFIRNRVQLVPRNQSGRRANISDILRLGDSLRTARASRAELRFNDGSLARVGERATFRFTPDTRNFQLNNGTILLLIPPGRGRSSIQTPNAVTGIQGSALFVRYIPETDTTIVGALTDNPDGPMVLFNRDGTEQQALRANEIGVVEGDQITELYQFDGTLFWQSSGLAEGFNYLSESTSTDELDGVREEIREAISTQGRLNGESIITNPEAFKSPTDSVESDIDAEVEDTEIEFEGSPAQEYESSAEPVDEQAIEVGVNNSLQAAEEEDVAINESDAAAGAAATTDEEATDTTSTDPDTTNSNDTISAEVEASDNDADVSDVSQSDNATGNGGAEGSASAAGAGAVQDEAGAAGAGASDGRADGAGASDVGGGNSITPDDGVITPETGGLEDTTNSGSDVTTNPTSGGIGPDGIGNVGPDVGDDQLPGDAQTVDSTVPTATDTDATFTETDTALTETVDNSDVTVPDIDTELASDGEALILDPVPDQVDKLNEVQTVHDLEMHDPEDGAAGAGAVGPETGGGTP